VSVAADATSEGKLLPCGGVLHVQGALHTLQLGAPGPSRTVWQVGLGNVGDPLELFMTKVTEVSRAEAEEHSHRAAVATLVLQVVSAVLGAHLGLADVAAAPAHELLRVEGVSTPGLEITPRLASEVSLATFEADIICVSVHGKTCRIIEPPCSLANHSLAFGHSFILKPH